jgi:hypothetical protein
MGDHSMNEFEFHDAISALVAGKGFRIVGIDLDTLEIEGNATKPSIEAIEAKMVELKTAKEAAIAEKAAAKAALLARLNMTEDEAKLLLS